MISAGDHVFEELEADEEHRDLGFGTAVARDSRLRLLNRDGTFNVNRHGVPLWRSVPIYDILTTITWGRFYLFSLAAYVVVNLVFGATYLLAGPDALDGFTGNGIPDRFTQAFFFSVHTITTVGYGNITPVSTLANVLVAVEALIGLGGFAVVAALIFARLARPTADIRFSRHAIVGPYAGGSALMFRIANGRRSQMVDASVRVMFSWLAGEGVSRRRHFDQLELERRHITFFPLHWTIVHPIDESSPLYGWTMDEMRAARVEILVQVAATDENYAEVVRARSSYVADEIQWDARFANIFEENEEGVIEIDLRRLHETIQPAGSTS